MECPLHKQDLQVKDSREKQLHSLPQGIGFNISVQSDLVMIVSICSIWLDLWNNYEMRELE